MSYSREIKESLVGSLSSYDRRSFIIGILLFASKKVDDDFIISTDSLSLMDYYTKELLLYDHKLKFEIKENKKGIKKHYDIILSKNKFKLLNSLDLIIDKDSIMYRGEIMLNSLDKKRGFFKALFLSSGTINNPNSSYHLEFNTKNEILSNLVIELFLDFEVNAKINIRKNHYIVYTKDANSISNVLRIIGASNYLMNFENVRIEKQVKNNINRKVNCETSNIKKVVGAALKQIDYIEKIIKSGDFNNLSEEEQNLAKLRLENPELSMEELGKLVNPKISKSCVVHRFRKIKKMAELEE